MGLRAQVLYQRQVLQIHHQNQIKSSKVAISHLPRSEVRQVIAAFGRMRLRSFVGWAIGVVVVCTSRVDLYPVCQALVNDLLPENAMRCWTAANIAHADKQYRVSKGHRSDLERLHHGAASLDLDGTLNPLSLRTNCNDASRISISVAGGSKLKRVLMLRHMVHIFQSGITWK
jgi:hypothetical protein